MQAEEKVLKQVVGYVVFTANRLALHISKVAVAPSCRRRGIATALVQVCS